MKRVLDEEGVFILHRAIKPDMLGPAIDEYQSTDPDLLEPAMNQPVVGFWTFVAGEKKRFRLLEKMPAIASLAREVAGYVSLFTDERLRLLESIVFNKPPQKAGLLHWHQDVSYFPLEPNNQIACWIPFDVVTENSGAMVYAIGSHLKGTRGSSNLLSGVPLDGETRDRLPRDPRTEGYETRCFEMLPGDMLVHDGRTWHASGPNNSTRDRRGLSFRYIVGETRYKKQGGSAGPFTKQTNLQDGDLVDDPAFPVMA
jgi:ectoine hydroxylase-related dioxygenase (phytanoyl-CoA dioxygenase family)